MARRLRRVLPLLIAACLCLAAPALAQDISHVVQPGENLFRISLRYGVDVPTLAQVNGIANSWQIYSGQVLIIPAPGSAPAAPVEAAPPAPAATTTHTITGGETLGSIARAYGMTIDQLASLNNITNPNLIYRGQVLTVAAPGGAPPVEAAAPPAPAAPEPAPVAATTTHIVQPGEYLSSIARRYGVSWTDIAAVNNISNPNTVFVGTTLTIPAPGAAPYAGAVEIPAAPSPTITVGKQIIVDLSDSRTYAYENGALVRNVLSSMGRSATPTIQGAFTIQRKYVSAPMTGPGYYLPEVPYIMYFYSGYALHGTYWHANFGQPMSHGCVNLPTPEAEWFFNWSEVGTPVLVQY
jgi:LysM repeat protein